MNILVIQTTHSGIYYHRQYTPHFRWRDSGEEFKDDLVVIVETQHLDKLNDITQKMHFDIVLFSIAIAKEANLDKFAKYVQMKGSKVVLDIDDRYHKDRNDVKTSLKIADGYTTVSDSLADFYLTRGAKRRPYVIENGIDTFERQFTEMPVANEEVVFGYFGSTRHEEDLRIMDYDFSSRELVVVCEEYNEVLDVNYASGLRSWSDYAWEYNAADVALAPLVYNKFNEGKSFLKVIEAGFKKKAIICSDTQPYNRKIHSEFHDVIDLIPLGTSWKDRIESYTLEEAHQRGEELYKLVQPYDIKNLNKKRRDIYQTIIDLPRR
tara:strand:- start:1668 stop:2633 length:966 start_codon:yes stop_codon:yes gene_type:complete